MSYILFGSAFPCVGASGAIMGLLGAIVAIYPQRIYVLLPLMIPMRAAVLAVMLCLSHIFFILTPYGGHVAYDVHLFGGFMGFAYASVLSRAHRSRWKSQWQGIDFKSAVQELEGYNWRIAREGMNTLTPEEQQAQHRLQRALRYEDVPTVEEIREELQRIEAPESAGSNESGVVS